MTSTEATGPYQSAKKDEFDIWLLISALRRHLPVFMAIVIVCLLIAFGFTSLQTPMYTAHVSIMLDPRSREVVSKDEQVFSSVPLENMSLETQVRVLTSNDMARFVAEQLNLKAMREFKSKYATPAEILQGMVAASRTGQTYVIDLAVRSPDPKLAAKIAQAYGDAYIHKQEKERVDVTENAVSWLNSRLDSLRADAEAADSALQSYKIKNNLMSAQGATMAEQEISSLNSQMAQAKADLSERRARRDTALLHLGANDDVAEAMSTDLVRALRKKRSDVAAELARLQANYGPKYPEVVKDQKQLSDIDDQIKAENARTLSSLNAEVRIAEQRYNSLLGSQNNASSSLRANNVAEVGLLELQRRADAARSVYESFLTRAREVTAQVGMEQPNAAIIESARVPNAPSSPDMKLNLAFGLLAGLLIGGAWIGGAELLDQTYKSGRELTQDLGLKNLTSIPLVTPTNGKKNNQEILTYVLDKPYSLFSESIRSLRAQIGLAARNRPMTVIAVTSALPQEGKTLTSLSLARSLASNGAKVLMIDADMRRLSLTKYLNASPKYGLQDVVAQPHLINESIMHDEASGADMILVPRKRALSTEVFTHAYFEAMIKRLRQSYDFIVLDTAPVLALSDIRVISSLADAVLLVVRWNKTPKDAVVLASDILTESDAKVLGVCLNQVDTRASAAHGYGDSLHYFNNFKEYWSDQNA